MVLYCTVKTVSTLNLWSGEETEISSRGKLFRSIEWIPDYTLFSLIIYISCFFSSLYATLKFPQCLLWCICMFVCVLCMCMVLPCKCLPLLQNTCGCTKIWGCYFVIFPMSFPPFIALVDHQSHMCLTTCPSLCIEVFVFVTCRVTSGTFIPAYWASCGLLSDLTGLWFLLVPLLNVFTTVTATAFAHLLSALVMLYFINRDECINL